jgi:hypothetical protein
MKVEFFSCWLVDFIEPSSVKYILNRLEAGKMIVKFKFILFLIFSLLLQGAIYKDKTIDKVHYDAKVWMKGSEVKYRVDVVFVKKTANLVFARGQVLPLTLLNNRYLTLYLFKERIEDPAKVILKQVKPPIIMNDKDKDPDKWEVSAIWVMDLDLSSARK